MATSSTSAPANRRPSRVVQILRNNPLVCFFALAYGVTWLLWTPAVILGLPAINPTTQAPSLYVLPGIAIGVTGSAFLMTAITQGKAGVRRLLRRLTWWRVAPQWFVVALLLIPLSEVLVAVALGSPDALRALTPTALLLYPAAYLSHFFFGPVFEEPGWRGFALPRMQHRFGPFRGSLLLGLLWSGWHLFLYVPGWLQLGMLGGVAGVGFFLATTALAFIFTWLSNNAKASLLLAMLLHGSADGTATYMYLLAQKGAISSAAANNSAEFGVLIICVLWAVVLTTATRGRLSYQRYLAESEQLGLDQSAAPSRVDAGSAIARPSPK